MALLTADDLSNLFRAAADILSAEYQGAIRSALFTSATGYLSSLKTSPIPRTQLLLDLGQMNEDEYLADGLVPLETWLSNLNLLYGNHRRVPEVRKIADRLTAKTNGAPPPISIEPPERDITLEALIGSDDTLPVRFLAEGAQAARSVAKLLVPRYLRGQLQTLGDGSRLDAKGTGWLLTHDLLITNHHVVNARRRDEPGALESDFKEQAAETRVQFDFDLEDGPIETAGVSILEISDTALDFAILRLDRPMTDRPLPRFRIQPMTLTPGIPFRVNIIQHPKGKPKRVACRNNILYSIEGNFLRYGTDTEEGSSGSPIYDDAWSVVGLHHASTTNTGSNNLPYVNRGILWSAIQARLAGSSLLREIEESG